jgi:hypothetical protein
VFGRRRNAGDRDRDPVGESAADWTDEADGDEVAVGDAATSDGPWDVAEPHPETQRVDLGSLQVPVLEGLDIQLVFAEQHGAWVTVRHELSELQLQAFAAPKRDSLWDDVRAEIAAEITGGGGMVTERTGPFGAELLARVSAQQPGQPQQGTQLIRFTGVDGPRWFLRGVFSGAAAEDPAAAAPLEAVLRDVVVIRGDHPVPPRDLLELRLPPEAAAALEEQARAQQEQQEQQEQQGDEQPPQQINRFSAQPNPFERGPEFTETR